MGKRKADNSDRVVRLEDTYDPADYVLVHKRYFDGMRAAVREAHGRCNTACLCIYCAPSPSAPSVQEQK